MTFKCIILASTLLPAVHRSSNLPFPSSFYPTSPLIIVFWYDKEAEGNVFLPLSLLRYCLTGRSAFSIHLGKTSCLMPLTYLHNRQTFLVIREMQHLLQNLHKKKNLNKSALPFNVRIKYYRIIVVSLLLDKYQDFSHLS